MNAAAGGIHFTGENRHQGVQASAGGVRAAGLGACSELHWLVAQTLKAEGWRGRQGCWRKEEGEGRKASSHQNGDCCENGLRTPLPTPPGPPGPAARPSVFSEPLTAPEPALSGPFPTAQGLSPSPSGPIPSFLSCPPPAASALLEPSALAAFGLRSPVYLPVQTLGLRPVKAPPGKYSSPAPSGHRPSNLAPPSAQYLDQLLHLVRTQPGPSTLPATR